MTRKNVMGALWVAALVSVSLGGSGCSRGRAPQTDSAHGSTGASASKGTKSGSGAGRSGGKLARPRAEAHRGVGNGSSTGGSRMGGGALSGGTSHTGGGSLGGGTAE
jgi:hypothetical protein